ncbi:MAG TPA: hypothetical protein PLK28_17690 [Candidatus Rifleibacterium sp.]|nr:hypothetical protein [Candidatus Rifleibacterium sp.]
MPATRFVLFPEVSDIWKYYNKGVLNFYIDSSGAAYQPDYFFADRRSAILGSIRIDDAGCSRLILLLSFRSAEPLYPARFCISTSCAKQAYEKVIPASLLACLKQFLMSFCINKLLPCILAFFVDFSAKLDYSNIIRHI